MKFKMCEQFDLPVSQVDLYDDGVIHHMIEAHKVELLLSSAAVAYGCGDENAFSLLHGEGVNPEAFELKGLVLGLERTNNETTQSIIEELSKWSKGVGCPGYVKVLIDKLAEKRTL